VTDFTFSYLARLASWGIAAALVQGGLIWLSWKVWDRRTRHLSARVRYNLLSGHIAALLLLPVLAVLVLHAGFAGMGPEISRSKPPQPLATPLIGAPVIIAVAWLAGIGAMLWRLSAQLRGLDRLALARPPLSLTRVVRGLWGRKLAVRVADVSSPFVIGATRPVLIAPRGLEARLAPAERDAVLLHELAHVERRDFAWNIVLRVGLALIWFNPFAWRLYRSLAQEREAACDALAVARGASPVALARALVRLAETASGTPQVAMLLSAQGALTSRVHRLLEPTPAASGGALAVVAVTALCFAGPMLGGVGRIDRAMADVYVASAFGPVVRIQARDPAGPFALKIRQGRVIEASIQGAPSRVVQVGQSVTLLGTRAPSLSLHVSPHGVVTWEARQKG
jgi:Zn-dependent protease with chaperone function